MSCGGGADNGGGARDRRATDRLRTANGPAGHVERRDGGLGVAEGTPCGEALCFRGCLEASAYPASAVGLHQKNVEA